MQQSYVTQHLHLKRNCTSNTRRQFTFNLRALDSGDCSEVAFVDWWDNFLAPAVLPTTRSFSCRPLGLQSSQIKFLMRAPSVRKHVNRTLYKLLRCQSSLREANLRPSQPSIVLKAQLGALLISSLLSRLLRLMGYFAWHLFSRSVSPSSLQYELSGKPLFPSLN